MSRRRTSNKAALRGVPVVLSGPAGVGKTVVAGELVSRHPELYRSVSATSRRRGRGEKDGRDYHFLTREEFERRLREGEFLEHTEHLGHLYGTLRGPIEERLEAGQDVILTLDIRGGEAIRRIYRDRILIFLVPPSMEALRARIEGRGRDRKEDIGRRLELAAEEMRSVRDYDYVVVNADLEEAVRNAASIVAADRLRRDRVLPGLKASGVFPEGVIV